MMTNGEIENQNQNHEVKQLDVSASARPSDVSENVSRVTGDQPPVTLNASTLRLSDNDLAAKVRLSFNKTYKQEARTLQVESVVALARERSTFLLAGTGYGKTRIAEMFRALFSKKSLAIVLVLNPLDALGDNQVGIELI